MYLTTIGMHTSNIVMKEVDKNNFDQAKQFILNCLLEQGYCVFKFIFLKSSQIQVGNTVNSHNTNRPTLILAVSFKIVTVLI